MKVLFFCLIVVAGAFARSAVQKKHSVLAEGPVCPLPDPYIRDEAAPIEMDFSPIFLLEPGSEISDIKIEGLTGLHYSIDLNVVALSASFEVTIDSITGNATYTVTGHIDASPISEETIPRGDIVGTGLGKISASGVHLKGRAAITIIIIGNKVNIRTLTLETVNFDSLNIDLGTDITIGGKTVDWADLSANIKQNFDREFAENQSELTEIIRGIANRTLGHYTLAEILKYLEELGQGEC